MKAVFLALLFVAGAFAQQTGPACPIDDPLITDEGPLNVTLTPILVIEEGGWHGVATFRGLSTLTFEYTVNIITLTASFTIDMPSIDLDCAYADVVGWIDATPLREATIPSGDFVGRGTARLTASNARLQASAQLFINLIGNKIGILTLNIQQLTFASLSGDLGQEFLVDGAPINWTEWSASFKANFDADFVAFKTEVTEKIRLATNGIIGRYTLEELLEIIGNIGGGDGGECEQTKIYF